jgi:hypothetical protein
MSWFSDTSIAAAIFPKLRTFLETNSGRREPERNEAMGFGRGILLWLLGIPIPIIILLALFWHH